MPSGSTQGTDELDYPGGLFNGCADGVGSKKLIAGVWYSLYLSDPGKKAYQCQECSEKKRDKRNCGNRKGLAHPILLKGEWRFVPVSYHRHEVQKVNEVKFFTCPMKEITGKTWHILKLINSVTDPDCNVIHLPFPGSFTEQPSWFHEAVRIVKSARAENQQIKRK